MEIKRILTVFSLAMLAATAACDAGDSAEPAEEVPATVTETGEPIVAPEVTQGAIIADTSVLGGPSPEATPVDTTVAAPTQP